MWLLLSSPSLLLLYGVFLRVRGRDRPRWALALGWLTLWILPALVVQSIWWLSSSSPYSGTWSAVLLAAPVGLWVLLGGRSCVEVFEATARSLTGHRSSTMLDNVHVFLALTAIQCAVAVAILARRNKFQRDPLAYLIGAVFCVNALMAAQWPWWGS